MGSSETQVTPVELGELLVNAAGRLAQELIPSLIKEGYQATGGLAFNSTAFSMIALQAIVAEYLPAHALEIGAAMRRAILDLAAEAGVSIESPSKLDDYLLQKSMEYSSRFAAIDHPLAVQQFGKLAAGDFFQTEEEYIAMIVATHFMTIMRTYPDVIAQFEIVE